MKTAIIGIGGVGATIGGFLLKNAAPEDRIFFVARKGRNHDALERNGLVLRTEFDGTFAVCPHRLADTPAALGDTVDLAVVCVKGYSLRDVAESLGPIVGDNTVVLPILNGVETAQRMRASLDRGILCDGCTYITGTAVEPGVVAHQGRSRKIIFGGDGDPALLAAAAAYLQAGGIDAAVAENIRKAVWNKYLMVCSFGVCTAYFDANVGQILASPKMLSTLTGVLEEIAEVAGRKGVGLDRNCVEQCLEAARGLNPTNTSSLKRDLDKNDGSPTELALFSPFICELGEQLSVPTPCNRKLADSLLARWRKAGERI